MILDSKDQRVFFGDRGNVEFLRDEIIRLGGKKCLIVTGGKSFQRSGGASLIHTVTEGLEADFFSVSGKTSGPEAIREGVGRCLRLQPDVLIGIGGGAVLDMCKLIGFFSATGLDPAAWTSGEKPPDAVAPFSQILIPTTSGSGSEATAFAVMYDGERKYSVAHSSMLAESVLLAPALTESMSRYQAACSGFDALAQSIESYLAVGATTESRAYSMKAVSHCCAHLEPAVNGKGSAHREEMLLAAHWAGKAINIAKTTAAHALSYILTSRYGVPHGHAVALLLPHILRYNEGVLEQDCNHPKGSRYVTQYQKDLCAVFDCETGNDLANCLNALAGRLKLNWDWVMQGNYEWDAVMTSIQSEFNAERLQNNPRKLTVRSIAGLVHKILQD